MKQFFELLGLRCILTLGFLGSWYLSFKLSTSMAMANDIESKIMAGIITTVFQTLLFTFMYKKKYILAYSLLFISIVGNFAFWHNQHNNYRESKIQGSSTIQSIKKSNSIKEMFLKNGSKTQNEILTDYDNQIADKEAEIIGKKNNIKYIEGRNGRYKSVGAWYRGEEIKRINKEINNIEKQLDKLRESKRNDLKDIQNDLKETATSYQTIDYSNTSDLDIYSEGYLGTAKALSDWTGFNMNSILFGFIAFMACVFEISLVQLKLILFDLVKSRTSNNDIKKRLNTFKKRFNNFKQSTPKFITQNKKASPVKASLNNIDTGNIRYKGSLKKGSAKSNLDTAAAAANERKRVIGFKPTSSNKLAIDEATKIYIKTMLDIDIKENKNGVSAGFRRIAKESGLGEKVARECFELLKRFEIINTNDKNRSGTIINIEKAKKYLK